MDDLSSSSSTKSGRQRPRSVYCITKKDGSERAFWTKVGVAWLNQDQSWNVYLDCVPLSGKLNIREENERPGRWGNKDDGPAQQSFDPLAGIQ